MAGKATGDEQQLVREIGNHADSLATGRGVDEQLGCAALHVAAEDVPGEQIASVERLPAAGGDALCRGRARQHDDLGGAGRSSGHGNRTNQHDEQEPRSNFGDAP